MQLNEIYIQGPYLCQKKSMLREEDYTGYEDQQLYNKWYKEAQEIRRNVDYVELKRKECGSKADQLKVPSRLGSRNLRSW